MTCGYHTGYTFVVPFSFTEGVIQVLDDIISGTTAAPPRLIVYGQEGIGKSTFAASAPKPLFIPTEDGLKRIDCKRFPVVKNFGEFIGRIGQLCQQEHDFETAVVDTADWLEKLIWAETCRRKGKESIEDIGYGKGYQFAMDLWKEVVTGLDYLHGERGMVVILLAHAKVERFNDPEQASYDRYTLRLHRDADAYLREWADAVLFAHRKVRIQAEDLGFNKTRNVAKAIGSDGGERLLRTVPSPAAVAKNRYGMVGDIPLSWEELSTHLS